VPHFTDTFSHHVELVRTWFDAENLDHSKSLVAGYYDPNHAFRGATFDQLAGKGNASQIEETDLDAIRALSIHPSRQFVALTGSAEFRADVSEVLRNIPEGLMLEELSRREFDDLLEPGCAAWEFWEVLAANMRSTKTREFNVGASKLASSKRPTLIPIEDSLVRRLLKVRSFDTWRVVYVLVRDPTIRRGLSRLRDEVPAVDTVPLHRILDVVAWRRAQGH